MSATSAANAWAVGFTGPSPSSAQKTLILHWNGSRWTRVTSPDPGGASGSLLFGVSAASASSAWAVGAYYTASGGIKNLAVHWNGTSWKQVAVPGSGGLSAVSADAASDAWAIGQTILHWNGRSWTQAASLPAGDVLSGVSARSASDVWAVGCRCNLTQGTSSTLTLHWDGTSWRQAASPNPAPNASGLAAADTLSATGAWAVGDYCRPRCVGADTLALHWDGTSWRQDPSPNPGGANGSTLSSVTALSPSNAWAVGDYVSSNLAEKTLVLHWNGTAWKQVASPTPSAGGQLNSVSAVSSSSAWAAGYVNFSGTTLILHWNGKSWTRF